MIDKVQIEKLAEERIEELDKGLYLVDITIGGGNRILVELDVESGFVSIEDCMSVSRNIEHNLDREIEDFSLEVSSAGIDRPFRVFQQYLKNIGNEVKIIPIAHGKSTTGILKSVDDKGVIVETKEKKRIDGKKKKVWVTENIPFSYNEIKETKLVISF